VDKNVSHERQIIKIAIRNCAHDILSVFVECSEVRLTNAIKLRKIESASKCLAHVPRQIEFVFDQVLDQ
jgi:hypothetical protein